MKQGSIWSWLSGDLPGEPLPGQSLLELTGDRQVLIENHRGVTQYSREQVGVKVAFGEILLCGRELVLARMRVWSGSLMRMPCIAPPSRM